MIEPFIHFEYAFYVYKAVKREFSQPSPFFKIIHFISQYCYFIYIFGLDLSFVEFVCCVVLISDNKIIINKCIYI